MVREGGTALARAPDEFANFFRDEYGRLIAFLYKAGFRRADAEDAASKTMTLAHRRWDSLATPQAWVRKVAYRIALRDLKHDREKIARLSEKGWDIEERDGTEPYNAIETRATVLRLLEGFPTQQRLVMAWHLDGFTNMEIAAGLNMRQATVRSHLRHAKARLKAKANEDEGQVPA